ncbi:MAG: N-acetyl sugar amidotransferase [Rhodospirillales bacterium]
MTFKKLLTDQAQAALRSELARNNASMDAQLAVQPKEVRFCKKCVVSNQRPRIVFDEDGVCSACRYAEYKHGQVDWAARSRELETLLDRYRSKDGSYDVIVPCSGGKDSSMTAHRLKHDFGMHPLTVTWAPFLPTDIGRRNMQSFVQSGFDNITCAPDGIIHRKLARLCFDLLGDAWQPFAYGQLNFAMNLAAKFGINLVFFGENGEAEYGGSTKSNDKPCFHWDDWEEVYLKGALVDRMIERGIKLGVIDESERHDVSPFYRLPPLDELRARDVQFHWFGYYHKWVPQENFYYASEHTGFEANPGRSEGTYSKYASLDDQLDGFHYYLAFIKFGIGRTTSDAAHEVRDGHLTRDEAVELVRRFDGEFPARYFDVFKDYIDITEEDFHRVLDAYRPDHLWERQGNGWALKHSVWQPDMA